MILTMFKKRRVYLDYAAATPLSKAAWRAMRPWYEREFGNPSAVHQEGARAAEALTLARVRIGKALQVRPELVTFVSGGTEANNLAIVGLLEALLEKGRTYTDMEVVTTAIEHPSLRETFQKLARAGLTVRTAPVDETGKIKLSELQKLLSRKTVLVSLAYANSEIGTIQPTRAIKRMLEVAEAKFDTSIYFHVDAAQAPLWLSCQFDAVGADLLSFDAGKCFGPKGVGVLVRSRRVPLRAHLRGGGQEAGLRPGTENVAGIVGASVALRDAEMTWKERAAKVTAVRDVGMLFLQKEIPNLVINGAVGDDRLANNINISLPGIDTEFATIVLDSQGFAVSTKSACAGAGGGESVVVREISGDPARARATLRFSLGPETSVVDLQRLTAALKAHLAQMKSLTHE